MVGMTTTVWSLRSSVSQTCVFAQGLRLTLILTTDSDTQIPRALSDMPDPSKRFSQYLQDHDVPVSVPKIYDENGALLNLCHYDEIHMVQLQNPL